MIHEFAGDDCSIEYRGISVVWAEFEVGIKLNDATIAKVMFMKTFYTGSTEWEQWTELWKENKYYSKQGMLRTNSFALKFPQSPKFSIQIQNQTENIKFFLKKKWMEGGKGPPQH